MIPANEIQKIYKYCKVIYTDQPGLDFGPLTKIRHYINVDSTKEKLDRITGNNIFTSFENVLSDTSYLDGLEILSLS